MQRGRGAFFSCTWVGGEPLLRRELVERGRKFFRANRVVTNGTLPLPDWKGVEFHVSIDGTRRMHDSIRGDGCYEKIKKNLSSANCPDIDVAIACCLNRANEGCIEDLIEEWRDVPHVKHILFDFFTPIKGVKVTRQAKSIFIEEFDRRLDPAGRVYYWQTGKMSYLKAGTDVDDQAMLDGYISITPLHHDLTRHRALPKLKQWAPDMDRVLKKSLKGK